MSEINARTWTVKSLQQKFNQVLNFYTLKQNPHKIKQNAALD